MSIAGIGLRHAATAESLKSALSKVDMSGVTALATPADKASFAAIIALGKDLGLEVIGIAKADLIAQDTITQSERVLDMRGTGSVAEAAALAAAGPHAQLTGPRVVSEDRMATCAVAKDAGE